MKTELDAAEGVKAVEETKEQIKVETAPKLQPKPVPNQKELTETTNAEIVQDQKLKKKKQQIFLVFLILNYLQKNKNILMDCKKV